ncbi:pelargonidin 3-O-(6-caffeoylglucoside) 5-O-(6-O-malonylglucoside) 4'''-malonyltransferase-like [Mercurialis annua]|uniref:pelargonidin 3-O-(6-caffeoylglucoside) 5-O-(6-O-malonylglucoside) 4'''-malonyltransferase-like n=1 Tax=Mercurialis annua TaxID=3986 RepID=UPI00215F41E2|nr:pelargonidin 3-O-(6-caffeoylglucoside) 5-O-(6-O-malonylglucoside) 4'''-malonyltransferase-like [Mercurialis annua]
MAPTDITRTVNNVPESKFEAVQTVMPVTVTDPRQIRQVLAVTKPIASANFTGCLNIILCYNKATENDSGFIVAGWIRESLARALTEQPLLAGRLRRGEDGGGELEIVSNDSGVRLVEASNSLSLKEFIDFKGREKAAAESQLVFWKSIDEQNPQFSPLFYVQVTNFECGGYSIGISCSILLADLVIMDKFLQTWAKIQCDMLSKNEDSNLPIFYLPNLKPSSPSLNGILSSTPIDNFGQTMIFNISKENMILEEESSKKLALLCIQEAEQNLGTKMSLHEFNFLVKETTKVIKVENCKKNEIVNFNLERHFKSSCANLKEYLKMSELAFREGNKAIRVSCWIGSVSDGFVLGIPSHEEVTSDFNIIITFPIENLN